MIINEHIFFAFACDFPLIPPILTFIFGYVCLSCHFLTNFYIHSIFRTFRCTLFVYLFYECHLSRFIGDVFFIFHIFHIYVNFIWLIYLLYFNYIFLDFYFFLYKQQINHINIAVQSHQSFNRYTHIKLFEWL